MALSLLLELILCHAGEEPGAIPLLALPDSFRSPAWFRSGFRQLQVKETGCGCFKADGLVIFHKD